MGDDSLSDLSGFTNISMESPSAGSLLQTPEAGSQITRTPIVPSARTCRRLKISPNTSTPNEGRSRHRRSLGDFILGSEVESGQKKKSPHGEHYRGYRRDHTNLTHKQTFSLGNVDDFPSLGKVNKLPANMGLVIIAC